MRPSAPGLSNRAVALGASLDAGQRSALAVAWRAAWSSRLLVWTAGVLGLLKVGLEPTITPPGLSRPFGSLGNLLSAPATAWDAGSYLTLAQYGYRPRSLSAFFPGYPMLMRAGAWSPGATVVAGVVVSLLAFLVALYLLHRLVSLECGSEAAGLTVLLVAFAPMALFFSAIYTESVFLALSVGAFYAARSGWWARAGIAGGLAATTRITGLVLILPLLALYLYGPREDQVARCGAGSWRPRFPLRRDGWFLVLVPAGALLFFVYQGAHGDFLAPLHAAQSYWHRRFVPLGGAVHGLIDAVRSLHQLAAGASAHVLPSASLQAAGQLSDPLKLAAADLTDFGFLLFAGIACVGVARRLPVAYAIYAVASVVLAASTFPRFEPLASFPRYLVVVFPCLIWLALWAGRHARGRVSLLMSAGLLAFFAAQFASWRWVA